MSFDESAQCGNHSKTVSSSTLKLNCDSGTANVLVGNSWFIDILQQENIFQV
jgi:hypothetical protein